MAPLAIDVGAPTDRADAARPDAARGPLLATEDRDLHPLRPPGPPPRQPGIGRADRPDRVGQDRVRCLGDGHLGRPGRRRVGEARPLRHDRRRPRRPRRDRRVRPGHGHRAGVGPLVTAGSGDHLIGGVAHRPRPRPGDPPQRRHQRRLLGQARREAARRVHGCRRPVPTAARSERPGAVPGGEHGAHRHLGDDDGRRHRPGDQPAAESGARQGPAVGGEADRPPRLDRRSSASPRRTTRSARRSTRRRRTPSTRGWNPRSPTPPPTTPGTATPRNDRWNGGHGSSTSTG